MSPKKLGRRLSLPAFVLVLGLAGPALPFSGRAAYASQDAAKEPAAEDDQGLKVGPDLGELGCRPEPGVIPDDARAQLTVAVRGKEKRDWWCF